MPTNQNTRWKVKKLIVAAMLALALPVAHALDDPQVAEFVSEMNSEHGFDTEWLNGLFADAEAKQKILDAISRPAERTKPWHEYREIFITPKRISAGVAFWREHEKLLDRVERQTGVPARMIVAILGVETFYGRITGGYRVIDALSTLAFLYPPRAKFFRSELEQFLLLTRESAVDPLAATGSYAGAMGAPQFIPSSFRAYAVDANDDGRIDLWTDWEDVTASVANYFREHGWKAGEPIAVTAAVEGFDGEPGKNTLKLTDTVKSLQQRGFSFTTSLGDTAGTMPIVLEGSTGPEHWVGFNNFYVITRYNRSAMYALAVFQLGEAVAAKFHTEASVAP